MPLIQAFRLANTKWMIGRNSSAFGLAGQLGISRGEAERYIRGYFARYAGVRRFLDETIAAVRQSGVTRTLFGRERPIPEMNSRNPNARGFAERTAVNSPLQGSAADLIKLAMVRVQTALEAGKYQSAMLLQVHDELVFECPPEEVDAVSRLARREMEGAEPGGPLTVRLEGIRYDDFPAVEWLLHFENRGARDTSIISDIHSMDMVVAPGIKTAEQRHFLLTKTDGDRTQPGHFMPSEVGIGHGESQVLSAGGYGRSSQKDLPFYKIDYDGGAMIVAVGWTGEWKSVMETPDGSQLHLTAGLERTHFLLHPGETVRQARMLVLNWRGDSLEANAQFRELVYRHYVRQLAGEKMLPRTWALSIWAGLSINGATAADVLKAMDAYGKIRGVQGFVMDCGWYQGGYNGGDGNYLLVDRKRFPDGFEPIAAHARQLGLPFGIWFDVEMNTKGTALLQGHPEWFLPPGAQRDEKLEEGRNPSEDPNQFQDPRRYLVDFGIPAAREAQLAIVEHYLDMPGFRFYRQDFNGFPFPYWSGNDAPIARESPKSSTSWGCTTTGRSWRGATRTTIRGMLQRRKADRPGGHHAFGRRGQKRPGRATTRPTRRPSWGSANTFRIASRSCR